MQATKFYLTVPDHGRLAEFDTKAEAFAEGRRRRLARFWVSDGTYCVEEDSDFDYDALAAAVRGDWNNCD